MKKKMIVVLNIVGLSPHFIETKSNVIPNIVSLSKSGAYRKMTPSFPAVTCSAQATLLSGKPPRDHGIVGNGFFNRRTMRTEFWAQESTLVSGPRIWDIMRMRDPKAKVAVLFWQNSKYIDADIVVTPSPLHTDTGMTEWCYSKPADYYSAAVSDKGTLQPTIVGSNSLPLKLPYYEKLTKEIGEFKLMTYWGPMAGEPASRWISQAGLSTIKNEQPDTTLVYIPHLDYNLQRLGPDSPLIDKDLKIVDDIVGQYLELQKSYGQDDITLFVISEYGMTPVKQAVFPNLLLRKHGLLKVREINGKEYIDFELSPAFAVVDHQVAHIYCQKGFVDEVTRIFKDQEGVGAVLDKQKVAQLECNHERAGELILLSRPDSWFAYYYWEDDAKAPFYARAVDIHNKPGYDPCELFVDMPTRSIPLKTELVKGSHGIPGTTDQQKAVMLCSDAALNDYAPEPFNATQFLGMLYRVI